MGKITTFFAIIKGYTTFSIFTIPIGFKYGGYIFSPLVLIVVCFFETTMAIKLSQVAQANQIYNYPDLVEYGFGKTTRYFFQIVVALLNFHLTFTMLSFVTLSLQRMTRILGHVDVDVWWFILTVILLFAPIVWIRTLETFRWGFIYSSIVIIFTIGVILYFESLKIQEHDGQPGPGYTPFNQDDFAIMLGISYATYEGIATVLPIMEASDARDDFGLYIALALGTLCSIHITFSEIAYYAYGNEIRETIIILQMPLSHPVVITVIFLFILVVAFSYPVVVFVVNQVIESLIFKKMKYSELRKWLKNLSRTVVLAAGVIIGTIFYYQIPKIHGIFGCVCGTVVVFIFPALLH